MRVSNAVAAAEMLIAMDKASTILALVDSQG